MHLYLDTAVRAAAESLLATRLFSGVTTNPTILRRAGRTVADIPGIYRWAVDAGAREVFFQAWGEDSATLVKRGRELRDLGPEVVVKLVVSRAGAAACAELAADGIPTLLTAVYDPGQALVAAAAGAAYIAPYLRRLTDSGRDADAHIRAMQEIVAPTRTRILLASIPDVAAMVRMARYGIDRFTMAPAVADELFADELTAEAVLTFERDVAAA